MNAFERVAALAGRLKDIPVEERERFREVVSTTYQLLDSALSLVIIRLGDVLAQQEPAQFKAAVATLDNIHAWIEMERSVRLCENLRSAHREMSSLPATIIGRLSVREWDELGALMQQVLDGEHALAQSISASLSSLAEMARQSDETVEAQTTLRRAVRETRASLGAERLGLVSGELAFHEWI